MKDETRVNLSGLGVSQRDLEVRNRYMQWLCTLGQKVQELEGLNGHFKDVEALQTRMVASTTSSSIRYACIAVEGFWNNYQYIQALNKVSDTSRYM